MPSQLTYENDGIVVVHGDALDLLDAAVADSSVNLVFADPPYNIGKRFGDFNDRWDSDDAYATWCKRWLDLCLRKLTPDGTLYVMTSTQAMPYIDLYLRSRLAVLSRIVWAYDSSGVQARKYFGSLYEPILHAVKNADRYTFNADAVAVQARTGAVRKLIDYRKTKPRPTTARRCQAMSGSSLASATEWTSIRNIRRRSPKLFSNGSYEPAAIQAI